MIKRLIYIMIAACILKISAYGTKATVPATSDPPYDFVQNIDNSALNEKETWSEQDVMSMFTVKKETNWEYRDCILFPDSASGCIGAVLFWDSKKETSNVAFFDIDGYFQQFGTYAKLSDEPDFTYLGDGKVTFKLKTDDDIVYNYILTISIDGSYVYFKAEDDLSSVKQ